MASDFARLDRRQLIALAALAGDFSYLRLTAPPKTGETVEARWGLKG